jgi:hypothetical protein
MPKVEPRSGLLYGWAPGENRELGMDENLLRVGRFGLHLSVIRRDLDTPPASPANGATYIVGPAATGAWEGRDEQLAIFDAAAGWIFQTPGIGWVAFVENESVLAAFLPGGTWSAGADLDPAAAPLDP